MSQTATVRARIVGRPKKNPGVAGPGTVNVRINALIAKKARVLANSAKVPLSDFLDDLIKPHVEHRFEAWRFATMEMIRVQDEVQSDWRDRLTSWLGMYQATGDDYVEVLTKRINSPDLDESQKAELREFLEGMTLLHRLYLDELLLKDVEKGDGLTDAEEQSAQSIEQQIYGDDTMLRLARGQARRAEADRNQAGRES